MPPTPAAPTTPAPAPAPAPISDKVKSLGDAVLAAKVRKGNTAKALEAARLARDKVAADHAKAQADYAKAGKDDDEASAAVSAANKALDTAVGS